MEARGAALVADIGTDATSEEAELGCLMRRLLLEGQHEAEILFGLVDQDRNFSFVVQLLR